MLNQPMSSPMMNRIFGFFPWAKQLDTIMKNAAARTVAKDSFAFTTASLIFIFEFSFYPYSYLNKARTRYIEAGYLHAQPGPPHGPQAPQALSFICAAAICSSAICFCRRRLRYFWYCGS